MYSQFDTELIERLMQFGKCSVTFTILELLQIGAVV